MPEPANITAVILCGGQGTRLKPVIGDLPKCLAPVAGRPFVTYILDHLALQGVRVAFFCSRDLEMENQLDELFEDHWKEMDLGYWFNLNGPHGTGGDLQDMFCILKDSAYSDPVLVVNGDTFCAFDLGYLVKVYHDKEILRFPRIAVQVSSVDLQAAGVWLIGKSTLEGNENALQDMLDGKTSVGVSYHIDPSRPFHDIGTPQGYAGAEAFLRQQGVIA